MSFVLTTNVVTLEGVQPVTETTDGSSDYLIELNDGNILLEVVNSGSLVTIQIETTANIAGIALANLLVDCPTGRTELGPFPPVLFNDATDNVKILAPHAGLVLAVLGH